MSNKLTDFHEWTIRKNEKKNEINRKLTNEQGKE